VKAEPTEAAFTRQVIEAANLFRWRAAHFRPAMNARGQWRTAVAGDGKGWPDLFLLREDRIIVAELKTARTKPTVEQDGWLDAFCEYGGRLTVAVWRPEDWDEIVEALR